MLHPKVRRLFDSLRYTPFHPQWFSFRREKENHRALREKATGIVLDIGCAGKLPSTNLPVGTRYIGLDYYETATEWYHTRPDIYGDAQELPILTSSIDTVLLLDVLEHLPQPRKCMLEIRRVLKDGGKLILQVPFLYPAHDRPLDFHRWTVHGLVRLMENHGFEAEEIVPFGKPMETAALLFNIAASRTVLVWIRERNPAALLGLLLPLLILSANLISGLLSNLHGADDLMPHSYRMVCVKR
jgi:SAM-dependent methyltransferase